jgi:hypothetical protein
VLSQLSYIPISIWDFGFWILDFIPIQAPQLRESRLRQSKSAFRNPKSAIKVVAGTGFEPATFGL